MADKSLSDQQRKKALTNLLGSSITWRVLSYLLVFIVLAELVVVPAQSLLHEAVSRLVNIYTPAKNAPLIVTLLELLVALAMSIVFFAVAKRKYEKWRTTLPLAVSENPLSKTQFASSSRPVHLFLPISTPSNREGPVNLVSEDLNGRLPSLQSGNFRDHWDKSELKAHNWRQPLLALNAMLREGKTPRVYLLCSNGDKGSINVYKDFIKSCEMLGPMKASSFALFSELLDAPQQQTLQSGIDFNDIQSVASALDSAVRALENQHAKQHIVIDVTGGTKLTSIAAAIVSFARDRHFQYTPMGPDAEVRLCFARYGDSEDN